MNQTMSHGLISTGIRRTKGGAGLVLYFLIALALLLLESFNNPIPAKIRQVAADTATPILSLVDGPIRATQDGIERLVGVGIIFDQNIFLQKENEELRHWQNAALRLSRENDRLLAILKGSGKEVPTMATGRVVGVGGGAFESSVVVNVGKQQNVERNWPVVNELGLVGRIISVGHSSSRVLLLTDLNSKVPVRVSRSGMLGILEGRNSDVMNLNFLSAEAEIRVGDRIITSGHGSMFPPDILIGNVTSVSELGVEVTPAAYLDRLDYVRILAYRLSQPEDLNDVQPSQIDKEGQNP